MLSNIARFTIINLALNGVEIAIAKTTRQEMKVSCI